MRHPSLLCLLLLLGASFTPFVGSSSVATETLIGIVGRDFVLLGADSSLSQSILLTATHIDKIAVLVDPFPDGERFAKDASSPRCHPTIVAAVAGDSADADCLVGLLQAMGKIYEYEESVGSDVEFFDSNNNPDISTADPPTPGLSVESMAGMARRQIYDRLRTRTPYRVGVLMAGFMPKSLMKNVDRPRVEDVDSSSLSSRVRQQLQQATLSSGTSTNQPDQLHKNKDEKEPDLVSPYEPHLYWLDEYGSLQRMKEYGVHGYASNLLWSLLDREYRPDLTLEDAHTLMQSCFKQLRQRYLVNPVAGPPCIKCIDMQHGCRLLQ